MTNLNLLGIGLTCLFVAGVSAAAMTISRRSSSTEANTARPAAPADAQPEAAEEDDEAGRKAAADMLKAREETVERLRSGEPAPYR